MEKKSNKKTSKDTKKVSNTSKAPKTPANNTKKVTKDIKKSADSVKKTTENDNEIGKSDDNIVKDNKKTNKDLEIQTAREGELLSALKEISKGEGVYSTDKLKHAENTIENMKKIAIDALDKYEKSLE